MWDEGDLDEYMLCEELRARRESLRKGAVSARALTVADAYCDAGAMSRLDAMMAAAREQYEFDVGKADEGAVECHRQLVLKTASNIVARCVVCDELLGREMAVDGIGSYWTCEAKECDFDVCARCVYKCRLEMPWGMCPDMWLDLCSVMHSDMRLDMCSAMLTDMCRGRVFEETFRHVVRPGV